LWIVEEIRWVVLILDLNEFLEVVPSPILHSVVRRQIEVLVVQILVPSGIRAQEVADRMEPDVAWASRVVRKWRGGFVMVLECVPGSSIAEWSRVRRLSGEQSVSSQ